MDANTQNDNQSTRSGYTPVEGTRLGRLRSSDAEVLNVSHQKFISLGHVLSVVIVSMFVAVYAFRAYQLDGWQNYFFQDSYQVGNKCSVATLATNSIQFPNELVNAAMKPMALPHAAAFVPDLLANRGDYYHAKYLCDVNLGARRLDPGIVFLHIGWVFGEKSVIKINGIDRLSFSGVNTVSIPLSEADLKSPTLNFEVNVNSKRSRIFGISSLMPIVITDGSKKNLRVLGMETAIENGRTLYSLLPALTLGIMLILAWLNGIRSRLVAICLAFVSYSVVSSILKMTALTLPWDYLLTYSMTSVFYHGCWLTFLVFGMEILDWHAKFVWPAMIGVFAFVLAILGVVLFIPESTYFSRPVGQWCVRFVILGSAYLSFVAFQRYRSVRATDDEPKTPIYMFFGFLAGAFACGMGVDRFLGHYNVIAQYVELLLPIFVGGLLLFSLSLSEKNYQKNREKILGIERDLTLAHEIQDSLSPPGEIEVIGHLFISSYQVKHSRVAGDWMGVHQFEDGEIVAIVADATGKGIQAALVVHAVQSLWADVMDLKSFNAHDWLQRVNRTLCRLGEKRPHSLTLGIVCVRGNHIKFWSAGHLPLFMVIDDKGQKAVKALSARGNILGMALNTSFYPAEFEIPVGQSIEILLATDGVLDRGSRSRAKDVLRLSEQVRLGGKEYLAGLPIADDKTLICLKKAA